MTHTSARLTYASEQFVKEHSPTGRLSKTALREALRIKPHLEFFNDGMDGGTYVNGNDAARLGLSLQVRSFDKRNIIGTADFQITDGELQAVVT